MQKRILSVLLFSAVIFMIGLINGCSSSLSIQNPVVGIIRVVGNEPFTKLAVNVNDKDVYLLECSKEIDAELSKNQGRVYEIDYTEVKKTSDGLVLVVKKAILIKTN